MWEKQKSPTKGKNESRIPASIYPVYGNCIYSRLYSCIIFFILPKKKQDERLIASLPLLSLFAHQVEEYVLSPIILGDHYHFINWAYRIGMDISPTEVVTINAPGWIIVGSLLLFKSKTNAFSKYFLLIN